MATLACEACGTVTTSVEAASRVFWAGRCGDCGGRLYDLGAPSPGWRARMTLAADLERAEAEDSDVMTVWRTGRLVWMREVAGAAVTSIVRAGGLWWTADGLPLLPGPDDAPAGCLVVGEPGGRSMVGTPAPGR